jgi:ATP-dependent 26S proteasome regulatory subunit
MYTFIDELDKLFNEKEFFDEEYNEILIIGTTSQIDKLDKSIRRGGRIDIDIRMDMPSDMDRF